MKQDDFFIIASDGIESLRQTHPNRTIVEVLLDLVKTDPHNFAANMTHACNRVYQESFNGTSRTLLAGHDDLTVLLIRPMALADVQTGNAAILGGQVGF
jgi:serine/threonine protein phosphatase PrpC